MSGDDARLFHPWTLAKCNLQYEKKSHYECTSVTNRPGEVATLGSVLA
jgi:hypothetical protein